MFEPGNDGMMLVEVGAHVERLSSIIDEIREQHGVVLYPQNLQKKLYDGPSGRESVLDRLARQDPPLARKDGRTWLVSRAAIPHLVALAQDARPGPPPGAQLTLNAEQLRRFAQHLAAAADPASTVREAIRAATGWSDSDIDLVERVVIPVNVRRSRRAPRQGT